MLTFVDVAAYNYYGGVIWQEFANDLVAEAALLGLLGLWIASAVVMWLHVAYDLRQIFRERRERLTFGALSATSGLRRDSNV